MSEWERSKAQPPKDANKPEEGAAEAAGPESREAQSAPEGEGSSGWPPASTGVTYELCAGLVDKPDLSLEEIARQEVLEECGYDIPASKLKRITSYRSARSTTAYTHLFLKNTLSLCTILLRISTQYINLPTGFRRKPSSNLNPAEVTPVPLKAGAEVESFRSHINQQHLYSCGWKVFLI